MMKNYIKSNQIEIRVADGGSLFIKAFLPTGKLSHKIFDTKNKRFFREKVCKGAFLNCIDKDNLKILLNHNYSKELKVKDIYIYEKSDGLYIEADIIPTEELLQAVEDNEITGVSYGFLVGVDRFEKVDGGWIRTIISFDRIMEISVLHGKYNPCYPLATAICCNNKEDIPKEELKALKKVIKQMRDESARQEIERLKAEIKRMRRGRY